MKFFLLSLSLLLPADLFPAETAASKDGEPPAESPAFPGSAAPDADAEGIASPDSEFVAALRLPGDPSECIALDKAGSVCVLTAEAFNRAAANAVAPPDWRNASRAARRKTLLETRAYLARSLASDQYFAVKAAEGNLRDSVERRLKETRRKEKGALGKSCAESRLDSLYRGRYAPLFAAKAEPEFSVLASTDSQAIDSLHRLLASGAGRDRAQSALPWRKCPGACREMALRSRADTLAPGASTRPMDQRFASLIFRLDKKRMRPRVPFEEAIPALCILAHVAASDAPPTEKDAREFYDMHPERFEIPDTVVVKAWLDVAQERKRTPSQADTARYRPRTLSHLDLPEAAGRHIQAYGDSGKLLKLRSDFGPWAFRILSFKPGRGQVPFAQAKPEILAELRKKGRERREQQAMAAAEAKTGARRSEIAEAVFLERLSPTPEELEAYRKGRPAEVAPDDPPGAGNAAAEEAFLRREFARERLERERERWLDEGVALFNLESVD